MEKTSVRAPVPEIQFQFRRFIDLLLGRCPIEKKANRDTATERNEERVKARIKFW
jgi:hypothetical protein